MPRCTDKWKYNVATDGIAVFCGTEVLGRGILGP